MNATEPQRIKRESSWSEWLCRRWIGLLVLLAVVGIVRTVRASIADTLWLDELHTISLSQRSVPEIFELLAGDTAPPLYTLLFKFWTEGLAAIGIGPGVWSGRMLGVVFWIAGTAAAWFLARRLVGARVGTLLMWTMAGAAQWGEAARNMRNYSLAIPLILCALLLLGILCTRSAARRTGIAGILAPLSLWILYGVLVGAAMLTHNLCGLLALILGVTWVVCVVRGGTLRSLLVWGGALGHIVALACFAPWGRYLFQQASFQATMTAEWQTPRTPMTFLLTLVYWLPGGELPSRGARNFETYYSTASFTMLVIGASTLIVPMVAYLWPRITRRIDAASEAAIPAGVRWLATTGMIGGLAWVVGLYNLEPLGFENTWHAPRYPSLGLPFWVCGLIATGAWAAARWRAAGPRYSRLIANACATPLLLVAIGGSAMQFYQDCNVAWVSQARRANARKLLRDAGLGQRPTLYATGIGLLPYLDGMDRMFAIRPAADLMTLPADQTTTLAVVRLNPWAVNDTMPDANLIYYLKQQRYSPRTDQIRISDCLLYLIPDVSTTSVTADAIRAYRYELPPVPAGAVAIARQESQRRSDGWGASNPDPSAPKHRWAKSPGGLIRFVGPLRAGNYTLHIVGQRNSFPAPVVPGMLHFGDEITTSLTLNSGAFHLRVPVAINAATTKPTARLVCTPWTMSHHLPDGDDSQVMYEFSHAWFEPAP